MLFAPPPTIEATPFASLSQAIETVEPSWGGNQPRGTPSKSLLEGPSFGSDGLLYCVDVQNGRVVRFSEDGACEEVVRYHGWPNGLKFGRDGRAYIADYMHGVMVLDLDTRRVTPLVERYHAERFRGVNDLFFAANGDLYFTDQGLTGHQDPSGRVFRYSAAGRLELVLDRIPSPNGLVMNLAENALYVAVTRANAVWRVPFMQDGSVAKVGTFIQLSGGIGPDGLALDANGGLAIAHVGMGSVWITDARGEPCLRITSTVGDHITNVAYGGEGNRTLFITESSSASVLKAELKVPGKKLFSQSG